MTPAEGPSPRKRTLLERELEGTDRLAREIAHRYERKVSIRMLYRRQSECILDYLRPHKIRRLLDLGCGIGNFLLTAGEEHEHLYGIDPSRESLKTARKLVPKARLQAGLGAALPFRGDVMDAVVMKGVVHHLEDPTIVFREVRRALSPGGQLVILEGNRSSLYRRLVLGIADLVKYDHESTLFAHRTAEAMEGMLREAGLEPVCRRKISGLFAPLALAGFGGSRAWKAAFALEDLLQRRAPSLFSYYILLAARKDGPG